VAKRRHLLLLLLLLQSCLVRWCGLCRQLLLLLSLHPPLSQLTGLIRQGRRLTQLLLGALVLGCHLLACLTLLGLLCCEGQGGNPTGT
jgi:hypothetical protein